MVAKKDIYTLLLLALLAFKVSSAPIHIHLHHEHEAVEHEEDCELCIYAFYYQNSEFSESLHFFDFEKVHSCDFVQQANCYESVFITADTHNAHTCRPPPALL